MVGIIKGDIKERLQFLEKVAKFFERFPYWSD